MAKAVYYPKGERQKTIIKLLNSLEGRYSRWDIWQDFIVLSAVSIANAFGGPYREQREAMYLERSKKYSTSELEVLAQMLAEVVDEMEQNPDQDMLGELFMALGLANEWKGQFFTPYDICRAMAAMNLGEDLKSQIEEKGWVSVSDPACGAGALLLAFANECKRNHINYQTSVFFVAQDIDFLAGCMCYIQMSLLGCPGYVVIDDSILHPAQSYMRVMTIEQAKAVKVDFGRFNGWTLGDIAMKNPGDLAWYVKNYSGHNLALKAGATKLLEAVGQMAS